MISVKYSYGELTVNSFIAGTNLDVKHFPVYLTKWKDTDLDLKDYIVSREVIQIVDNEYIYFKPENRAQRGWSSHTKYTELFETLRKGARSMLFSFLVKDIKYNLTITKGYIADQKDNILLLLTTDNFFPFQSNGSVKPEHLKLYISSDLIKNPIYKNIYRKIEKEYINKCYTDDIDVVITTSKKIEKRVFKTSFIPKFSTVQDLNNHLKNDVKELYYYTSPILSQEAEEESSF